MLDGGKMFGTLDTKHFESKELFSTLKSGKGDVCDAIVHFMTVMAVGHTVVAERTNERTRCSLRSGESR